MLEYLETTMRPVGQFIYDFILDMIKFKWTATMLILLTVIGIVIWRNSGGNRFRNVLQATLAFFRSLSMKIRLRGSRLTVVLSFRNK